MHSPLHVYHYHQVQKAYQFPWPEKVIDSLKEKVLCTLMLEKKKSILNQTITCKLASNSAYLNVIYNLTNVRPSTGNSQQTPTLQINVLNYSTWQLDKKEQTVILQYSYKYMWPHKHHEHYGELFSPVFLLNPLQKNHDNQMGFQQYFEHHIFQGWKLSVITRKKIKTAFYDLSNYRKYCRN